MIFPCSTGLRWRRPSRCIPGGSLTETDFVMRDWKEHQWIGAALMAIGFLHVTVGLYILVIR